MATGSDRGAAPPTGSAALPPAQAEIRFLSRRDVPGRLTISRSLLCERIRDPVRPFPAPVHIGGRSVWVESDVERDLFAVLKTARRRRGT